MLAKPTATARVTTQAVPLSYPATPEGVLKAFLEDYFQARPVYSHVGALDSYTIWSDPITPGDSWLIARKFVISRVGQSADHGVFRVKFDVVGEGNVLYEVTLKERTRTVLYNLIKTTTGWKIGEPIEFGCRSVEKELQLLEEGIAFGEQTLKHGSVQSPDTEDSLRDRLANARRSLQKLRKYRLASN